MQIQMRHLLPIAIYLLSFYGLMDAQNITQSVKGKVIDQTTQEELIGASIILLQSDPLIGTTSDFEGNFVLESIPVGRQSFEISMIGYESRQIKEVMVGSGKEIVLEISLAATATNLHAVIIRANIENDKAINSMATLSSRQFSAEESQRFAGGLNDPARLVSSFAGVAAPSINSNGISIRGNSPSGLLWRIEGVEIPSPNHFADLTIPGAGLFTALSSHTMGNSDFYTGAFPAEYGNATSGVFDINLRKGNTSKRESTIQAGLIGIDFATEGPIKKGNDASYIVNYRYSTLGLIGQFLPNNAGILRYQDLSYKVNLPTHNAGTFSLWGLGAYDAIDTEALEPADWESISDRDNSQTSLYLFASGLNHRVSVRPNTFLKTSLAFSGNGLSFAQQRLDLEEMTHPQSEAIKNHYRVTFQSSLSSYFGDHHSNRTGFTFNHLGYDLNINETPRNSTIPDNLIKEKGSSNLFQFYSQSKINLDKSLTLNTGIHVQYFQLTGKSSIEPRVALKYALSDKSDLAFAYGRHSQTESLPIYFVKDNTNRQSNKDLQLMKSNHFVLSYTTLLKENLKLSVEPYYQSLIDVPVVYDSYISTINDQDNLFFNHCLISGGKGKNVGIDFTLERYIHKGMYYLLTASVFDSKYRGSDGVERNTRFNKNYVFNALIGKEWLLGSNKNQLFGINLRLNYQGGNRIESIDLPNSIVSQEIIYGETEGSLSFSQKQKDTPIISFTVSYRNNKPRHSSEWSLQVINASQTKEFQADFFNTNTRMVEQKYGSILVPNLSYKIEF